MSNQKKQKRERRPATEIELLNVRENGLSVADRGKISYVIGFFYISLVLCLVVARRPACPYDP